jgi:ABC-type transport system involved in cytochrome c biogenesis permease component
VFFANILISTQSPDLGQYYSNIASTLIVLLPIVAMRSFAEERRSGVLDLTLSWPVPRLTLVLTRFVANTLLAWLLCSIAWVYIRIISGMAPLDMARAAGGYVGLLFLSMAFSALALMVSARAGTPTAAAFLGFGLLLFLWILDFAPGWIGAVVGEYGPSKHFESFARGVVYLDDAAYFTLMTLIGLALALHALGRGRPGPRRLSLIRRGAVLGSLTVVVATTPVLARRIDGQVDLTGAKRNTVAAATRDVLRRVDGPIHLTGFVQAISREATALRNVAKQYRAAGADLRLRIVDPDLQPALARQVGVTNYNQYVVDTAGRREVIDDVNQITLTGAINRLTRLEPPRACFTIGHGERSIDDTGDIGASGLRGALRRVGYDVRLLALAGPGGTAALERCAVVVVAGPSAEFLPAEAEALSGYAADEGRVVVLTDGSGAAGRQLDALVLAPFGIRMGQGIVHDLSSLAGDPASVVSSDYPTKNPAVGAVDHAGLPVVLPGAHPVQPLPGGEAGAGHVSALVQSSRRSSIAGAGTAGPFVLAAASDRSVVEGSGQAARVKRSRIGVVGTAEVATNRFLPYLGNRQFLTALVQWAGMEGDIIAAFREPEGSVKLALTNADKANIVRSGIVVPVAACLLAVPFTLLRLKRG